MTEWNEAQTKAITHKDGPMMVLAGPGSGKLRSSQNGQNI